MAVLTLPDQRALSHQVCKIPGRRRWGCSRDLGIVACAQSSLESLRAFAEHTQKRFLLTRMALQPIKKPGLVNEELDQ